MNWFTQEHIDRLAADESDVGGSDEELLDVPMAPPVGAAYDDVLDYGSAAVQFGAPVMWEAGKRGRAAVSELDLPDALTPVEAPAQGYSRPTMPRGGTGDGPGPGLVEMVTNAALGPLAWGSRAVETVAERAGASELAGTAKAVRIASYMLGAGVVLGGAAFLIRSFK